MVLAVLPAVLQIIVYSRTHSASTECTHYIGHSQFYKTDCILSTARIVSWSCCPCRLCTEINMLGGSTFSGLCSASNTTRSEGWYIKWLHWSLHKFI